MPSFRKAKNQAHYVVKKQLAIKVSWHKQKKQNKIHSIGTARNYEQALVRIGNWLKENKLGSLQGLTDKKAIHYLEYRAQAIGQKTLDQERQAIQKCFQITLPVIKSEKQQALESRAYTSEQVALITKAQTAKHSLATAIAFTAGLRAHELFTLRLASEQKKSKRRKWSKDRFEGREGVRYTVIGKGGLVREIMLSRHLSDKLEALRLSHPKTVWDRTVKYQQYYNIGGGKNWTNSFSSASKRLFGWSHGAHGLRHSYAQLRMSELQGRGHTYDSALAIVSQELGHFRPDITEVYLR